MEEMQASPSVGLQKPSNKSNSLISLSPPHLQQSWKPRVDNHVTEEVLTVVTRGREASQEGRLAMRIYLEHCLSKEIVGLKC